MYRFRFRVFKGGWLRRSWYFSFVAPNNERILGSEGYTRKQSAEDTIALIKMYAKDAEVIYDE